MPNRKQLLTILLTVCIVLALAIWVASFWDKDNQQNAAILNKTTANYHMAKSKPEADNYRSAHGLNKTNATISLHKRIEKPAKHTNTERSNAPNRFESKSVFERFDKQALSDIDNLITTLRHKDSAQAVSDLHILLTSCIESMQGLPERFRELQREIQDMEYWYYLEEVINNFTVLRFACRQSSYSVEDMGELRNDSIWDAADAGQRYALEYVVMDSTFEEYSVYFPTHGLQTYNERIAGYAERLRPYCHPFTLRFLGGLIANGSPQAAYLYIGNLGYRYPNMYRRIAYFAYLYASSSYAGSEFPLQDVRDFGLALTVPQEANAVAVGMNILADCQT